MMMFKCFIRKGMWFFFKLILSSLLQSIYILYEWIKICIKINWMHLLCFKIMIKKLIKKNISTGMTCKRTNCDRKMTWYFTQDMNKIWNFIITSPISILLLQNFNTFGAYFSIHMEWRQKLSGETREKKLAWSGLK